MQLTTKVALEIQPKMILEIASGIEEPAGIVAKYGISESEWLLLKEHPPFLKQVEDKKAELKATGYTFRMKSAIMAEDLLDDLYAKAKEQGASFHTVLETVKFTSRAAGVDAPKAEDEVKGRVTISINLGGQTLNVSLDQKSDRVIEHEAVEVTSYGELGEPPSHLVGRGDGLTWEEE